MHSRLARFARASAAAIVSTSVAAVSHTLAGAPAPHLAILALAFAFSMLVSIALTGRRLSLARLAAAVGAAQFAFHSVFVWLGSRPESVGVSGGAMASGHAHSATSDALIVFDGTQHGGAWMWLAHVAAALITIAALRRGESVVWGLSKLLARFFPHSAVATPIVFGSVRLRVADLSAGERELAVRDEFVFFRGPPALSF